MASWLITRRLRATGSKLMDLREELRVIDEQAMYLGDEATDAELRAMVSESPLDRSEAKEAGGHAEAMARHRAHVVGRIARLEAEQDRLLDQLGSG